MGKLYDIMLQIQQLEFILCMNGINVQRNAPMEYSYNSATHRLEVLQEMMITMGWCRRVNYEIYTH